MLWKVFSDRRQGTRAIDRTTTSALCCRASGGVERASWRLSMDRCFSSRRPTEKCKADMS